MDTPYFHVFSAHADAGCARPQGQAVLARRKHRSLRRPTGSPRTGTSKRTTFVLYGRGEHGGRTLTLETRTRRRVRRKTGRRPPPFSLKHLSPSHSQLRRWIVSGCKRRGSTPPCATSIPLYPMDGEGGFRPAHSTRVRPPALYATTKGTQERLPPQFSFGCLSPTRDVATQIVRPVCAVLGARRQHRPLARPTTCVATRRRRVVASRRLYGQL